MFLRTLKPEASDILLDVGGYPGFWVKYPQPVSRIDTLNLHLHGGWQPEKYPHHRFQRLVGDGCAMRFSDKSYDIAFSNSVIEHLETLERQKAFAAEILRVGQKIWVQTPAYECPIEPHFLTPFIHWLPIKTRMCLSRHFTVWGLVNRPTAAEIKEMVMTTRLLRRDEFASLFPDCKILTEYMFGLIPKSYIAVRSI